MDSHNTDEKGQPNASHQQQYSQPRAMAMPHHPPPYGAVPQYRPPVFAPLPIPSDALSSFLKGPTRMRLLMAYPIITGYRMNEEESNAMRYYTARGWMQLLADISLPLFVWFKSVKPMSPEQIEFASQGNPAFADRLRRMYGRGWGWPTPLRVVGFLGTWMALRILGGYQEEVIFEQIEQLQSPLGEYARYLTHEGRKAAEFGMGQVPHPPFTFPVPQGAPQYLGGSNNYNSHQSEDGSGFRPPQPQGVASF